MQQYEYLVSKFFPLQFLFLFWDCGGYVRGPCTPWRTITNSCISVPAKKERSGFAESRFSLVPVVQVPSRSSERERGLTRCTLTHEEMGLWVVARLRICPLWGNVWDGDLTIWPGDRYSWFGVFLETWTTCFFLSLSLSLCLKKREERVG